MQRTELDVRGGELRCPREQRRERGVTSVEGGGSRRLHRDQGGGGALGLPLAKGPSELMTLRPFPQCVYDVTCQPSYWELVW